MEIIGQIYEALDDDEALSALPDVISGEIGSRSCVIQVYSESGAVEEMWLNYFTPEMDDFYRENNLHLFDVFAIDMVSIGYHVAECHGDFRPVESVCNSFFYNEFLRRFGDDSAHALGFASPDANGSQVNVGLHKGRKQTDFTRKQVRKLDVIRPHLARMLNIRRNLRRSEDRGVGALMGIDSVEDAYLVLAADRRISFANAAADALLSNSGLLEPVQGNLFLHRPQDDQKLVCALDDANQNHRSGRLSFLGQDKSGATWRFTLAPKAFEGETRVLVWIDRCQASASAPEAMQQIYGLTEAELPILMAISQGMSAAEIADQQRISIATVRTHIQHVYQKTGVKKVSQLAQLVASLPRIG